MRVVLDTNVLIAALIARGVCHELFEHCVQHHEIVGSEAILSELREQLLHKFKYEAHDAEEAVSLMRSTTTIVSLAALGAPVCRDPDDDMILATALAGNAECILTGDQDLLVLKEFRSIRIVRPAEFVQRETRED